VTDHDDGHAISYKVLRRGTPVRSSDGVQLGTVRRTHEAARENIFDGIDVDTPDGVRFVDAPEVARVAERGVTLTFPAAEASRHMVERESSLARSMRNARTVRRARRMGDRLRERWDRR
jgi:hypothetical protein